MAWSLGTASEWGTYEILGPVPPSASDSSRDSEPGGDRGSNRSRVPSLLVPASSPAFLAKTYFLYGHNHFLKIHL